MTDAELKRFMSKVEERLGCLVWTSATHGGVGVFQRTGTSSPQRANRVAYEHFIGPIPFGAEVATTCDVRACVNQEHLVAIPRGSGSSRANKERFSQQTHCKEGHSLQDAYITPSGSRDCRECGRARKRAYKDKHRKPRADPKTVYVTCPDCDRTRRASPADDARCRSCKSSDVVYLKCPHCDEEFSRQREYVDRCQVKPIFCSVACRTLGGGYAELGRRLSLARGGDGNPSYRHGRRVGVAIPGWKLNRKGERSCRNCPSARGVQLHHAIPRSLCRATREELLNGIPLCIDCHTGWHSRTVTIYRDVFYEEEWAFLLSVDLGDREIQAWLDDHYPDRGFPFRAHKEHPDLVFSI